MDQQCCAEVTACKGDSRASASSTVFLQCGDDGACRSRCGKFFNRGEPIIASAACRERNCAAECGLSCGGLGYAVPGCEQCVQSSCCQVAEACAANPECMRLDVCRNNCLRRFDDVPARVRAQQPDGGRRLRSVEQLHPEHVRRSVRAAARRGVPRSSHLVAQTGEPRQDHVLGDGRRSASEYPFDGRHGQSVRAAIDPCAPIRSITSHGGQRRPRRPHGAGRVVRTSTATSRSPAATTHADTRPMAEPRPISPPSSTRRRPSSAPGWRGRLQFVSASDSRSSPVHDLDIDPTRGHFAANAVDCNFSAACRCDSSTAKSADDKTSPFYFLNGNPRHHRQGNRWGVRHWRVRQPAGRVRARHRQLHGGWQGPRIAAVHDSRRNLHHQLVRSSAEQQRPEER